MSEHIDVAIIGAGQAGLAMSYHLTQRGITHLVLEQHRLGEAWRNRWNSFTLVTPNWMIRLPGFEYSGGDPDGFMPRDELVKYLESYAESFNAPVRTGVRVTAVEPAPGGSGYLVSTDQGPIEAHNVVVAAGLFQRPRLPRFAAEIDHGIAQLHTVQYREPEALQPGAVLVVGTGQSGCQIAEELYQAGRKVYLTVGGAGRVPRRYRGRDCFWWLVQSGFFDMPVDKLPSPKARFAANPHVSGKNGGHSLNLHRFARDGVTLLGRMQDAKGRKISLAPGLNAAVAKTGEFAANLIKEIDTVVEKMGLDMPEDPATREDELTGGEVLEELSDLDLEAAGVNTIIWAMGYGFDFSWVKLPVFDEDGYPVQQIGVTAHPGLYFLGLPWLRTRKSGLFYGVGEDAEHLASHIAGRME